MDALGRNGGRSLSLAATLAILVASFARGLARDRASVHAAIDTAWSNAQAEGQITKLKLVKRQMYGRGKLDLLEARMTAG
jgi:transposase